MSVSPGSDTPRRARRHLRAILAAALEAGDAGAAVQRVLARDGGRLVLDDLVLPVVGRLEVLAAGKAAPAMTSAALEFVAGRPRTLVVAPGSSDDTALRDLERPGLTIVRAGHPLPDGESLRAGRAALHRARSLRRDDLLLFLVSGGASALLEVPAPGMSLQRLVAATRRSLLAGESVQRLNARRRTLSAIKGGGLAAAAGEATVLTLALSDVVSDRAADIGSGPTWSDHPTPGRHYRLVGTNELLVEGAAAAASELGYRPMRLGRSFTGEARHLGQRLAREAIAAARECPEPLCLLAAGESTVTVTGNGRGGRNQELALAAALELDRHPGVWFASAGSDGRDGLTPAAGAVADGDTIARAVAAGLDPRRSLENNDSWSVFAALDDHLVTGATNTNLMDLQIALIGEPGR